MSKSCKQNEASSNADLDLDELEGVAGGTELVNHCKKCGATISHTTWITHRGYCDTCMGGRYTS